MIKYFCDICNSEVSDSTKLARIEIEYKRDYDSSSYEKTFNSCESCRKSVERYINILAAKGN